MDGPALSTFSFSEGRIEEAPGSRFSLSLVLVLNSNLSVKSVSSRCNKPQFSAL